jgi:hypothetical protein
MQKLIILVLLAGGGRADVQQPKPASTFAAKRYDLPDGAYLQAVSMPAGRYVANTCIIYTNEKLGKTHMVCEVGAASLEGPEVESR